jgi:hypothetical protein
MFHCSSVRTSLWVTQTDSSKRKPPNKKVTQSNFLALKYDLLSSSSVWTAITKTPQAWRLMCSRYIFLILMEDGDPRSRHRMI